MFDPNALSAAIALSQSFSERQITLSPIPDTPLSLLVRETPITGLDADKLTYDELTSHLVDMSRGEDHAGLMNNLVPNSIGGVRQTLNISRNIVMPHIRRVLEAYDAAMDKASILPAPFDIEFIYQPEVYTTPQARELVDHWDTLPTVSSPGQVVLGNFTADQVIEFCAVTNNGEFNDQLKELLTADGGKGVTQIVSVLNGQTDIKFLEPQYALPMCLALQAIETPGEGVAQTLSRYQANRLAMANIAGKAAAAIMNNMSAMAKTGNIYAPGLRRDDGKIEVIGEVFREMAERGLTTEALFGNELLGRKYRGELLMSPEALAEMKEAYERDKGQRQEAHRLNRVQQSRKAIHDVLREDQRKVAEEGAWTVEGDTAEKSWMRLRTFVDKIMVSAFQGADAVLIISATICAVWYAHTDAARYIDIMFDVEKENAGLPSKEIATMATLRYIAEWVGSMIVVCSGDPLLAE